VGEGERGVPGPHLVPDVPDIPDISDVADPEDRAPADGGGGGEES
jgi:hypothetical protein